MSLLPVNFNTGRVYGRFVDLLGAPVAGTITFTASVTRLVDPSAQTIIIPAPKRVPLDATGYMTVTLPATNDSDVTPVGFTYQVSEDFPSGKRYSISVPVGAEVDLTTVVAVDQSTGTATVVGPPGVSWRGAWDGTLAYARNDGVYYNGSSYRAAADIPADGSVPDPLLLTPWAPIALAGGEALPRAYVHNQTVASATWTIDHNLGYFPNLQSFDSGGAEAIGGAIVHVSNMQATIAWSASFGGTCYAS